jgi:hypothetical protein
MKRSLRTAIGVLILVLSLALLAWGLWPLQHERRVLPVEPSNLTLPTPASFIPGPFDLA